MSIKSNAVKWEVYLIPFLIAEMNFFKADLWFLYKSLHSVPFKVISIACFDQLWQNCLCLIAISYKFWVKMSSRKWQKHWDLGCLQNVIPRQHLFCQICWWRLIAHVVPIRCIDTKTANFEQINKFLSWTSHLLFNNIRTVNTNTSNLISILLFRSFFHI